MSGEFILVPRDVMRALFDLAVNSMDFGSGFWDTEEVEAARAAAIATGVCPMVATPKGFRHQYPLCAGITGHSSEYDRHHADHIDHD